MESTKTREQLLEELETLRNRISYPDSRESQDDSGQAQLKLESRILDSINRVFKKALTCDSLQGLSLTCLEVAIHLTESEFGFIGEANTEGTFDTTALSNPAWEACSIPESNASVLITGMKIRGLWGKVLQSGEPLLTNDPSAHPDSVGVPEGHPPLNSFIGVPLKKGKHTFGVISLANKAGGYEDADLQALEALSIAIVQSLLRKKAETELQSAHDRLEEKVEQRAAELKESEQRFRTLFEKSTVGNSLTSPQGKLLQINERFADILGRTIEEMEQTNFAEITHPDDVAGSKECIRSLLANEHSTYRMEKRYIHKHGHYVWTDVSTTLLRNEDGTPQYFITSIVDISERKQAEEMLAKELETLEAVLDGVDDIIYVADPDTFELLHVNESFKKIWGADGIGKKCFAVLQNRSEPCSFCTNDKIFGEQLGNSFVWEFQNEVTKDWYRCSDKAIRWVNGKMVRFELASNITALKSTEDQLRRANEKLEKFLEGTDDLVTQVDAEGRLLYVNRAAEKYLGISPEEAAGLAAFDSIHEDDREMTQQNFMGWIQSKVTGASFENRQVNRKNGLVTTMLWTINPSYDEAGNLNNIWSIARDITERKENEQMMAKMIEALERSNKELEQFAYVASHDLQEPLRMISSYTQLLEQRYKDQLDEKANKYINYAVDGAIRMQRLINDLLVYSRVGTRGNPLSVTDSHSVLGEALRNLTAAIEENGAIVTNDDLPTINADASQLVQLFQNLVGNAIKFKGSEHPHVHISAEDKGREWLFTVSDNGLGMDMKYADRLFVIFQRLHTQNEYPGTGIGLAVAKRIVERHGGKIWFESTPGEGTTFFFTIPK